MSQTKNIRISLRAFTAVEYTEVIAVPAAMSDRELDKLVEQRYDDVDAAYQDDPDYWERGDSTHQPAEEGATPEFALAIADGRFHVTALPNDEQPASRDAKPAQSNPTTPIQPADAVPMWDYFVADNAETPHCGIMLGDSLFLTTDLQYEDEILRLVNALNFGARCANLLAFMAGDKQCLAMSGDNLAEWNAINSDPGELPRIEVPTEEVSETALTTYMEKRIANGDMRAEDMPRKLVQYGLMEPSAFIEEMSERMQLADEEEADTSGVAADMDAQACSPQQTPEDIRAHLKKQADDRLAKRLQTATSIAASDSAMRDHKASIGRIESLTDVELQARQ